MASAQKASEAAIVMTEKIVQIGDPVLRQPARALSRDEIVSDTIQQLIVRMKDTMYQAPGVGLAAPQIGESLQLVVIEDRIECMQGVPAKLLALQQRQPTPFYVIINPKLTILPQEGEKQFFEACLSISGFGGQVSRALAVRVECLNERAEPVTINARGWFARILQHEIDHLNGKLCIDRTDITTFMTVDNYKQYWRDKYVEKIK
jgi:peptide deformylase